MSDKINALFSILQERLLPHFSYVVVIAAALILALAVLSLYLLTKLKSTRAIISQLGERLGYDPPYGDGAEIVAQENEKESIGRDREHKVEQLEERIVELEGEIVNKEAELASHQQRWKELEGQLAEARVENEKAATRAGELAQAHQSAVERLEQHLLEKEAESHANLAAVQERSKELEDQLQQASVWGNKVTTMANDQAQAHRTLVEQLEQRMRDMEAEHVAELTAHQRRAKELEDRLHLASFQHEQIAAQASEQVQTHQVAVTQLEQRIRQMEVEGQAYLSALERHAKELEDQLRRALVHNEQLTGQANAQEQERRTLVEQLEERIRQLETGGAGVEALEQRASELEEELRRAGIREDGISAQANEQAQAYRTTIENLEQRVRDMEAEGIASSSAILQRSKELEEQLHQAHQEKDTAMARVDELAQAHRSAVEELEGRIRQMETDGVAAMSGLEARAKDLEQQLWQAHLDKDAAAAQTAEHAQAHQSAMAQLEERVRQLESEGAAGLADLQRRAQELEGLLQQAHHEKAALAAQAGEQLEAHRNTSEQLEQRLRELESESAAGLTALHQHSQELEEQLQKAQQETTERNAEKERMEQRIRDLEAEKDGGASRVQWLEAQVRDLEERLQTAASAPAATAGTRAELLRRAEWITACAVGEVLPHGLVAAEAYASAALAEDPKNGAAAQLLAELARIHRAFREGLPPVTESIATFEEKAAAFFAADSARAAEVAGDEARRRSRAGLNRSALLAVNTALELRQKTDLPDSQAMLELRELKATLVERLGADAALLDVASKIPAV